jgi:FlaA1/EpsC-like NDP-sugar epimerase
MNNINYKKLLERDEISIDESLSNNFLKDKVIFVSGGCGSIGSEIVRQLLKFNIKKIIIYDNSEIGIFEIENEINENYINKNISTYLGDVTDKVKLNHIFSIEKPNIIYHAAAYKHVPIVENNPNEGVKVNILGTKTIADLSIKHDIEKFVMVSTDKAVNPTNVMGATKRVAEIYINKLNSMKKTIFITTRFGNVLGSSGSVIPTFMKRIKNKQNLLLTHKDIIRYFMTIPEASKLVILASVIGNRHEILLFDMGEPVKIYDLAKNMIKLYGDKSIEIEIIGLRKGEKLYEELLCKSENVIETENKNILKLKYNDEIDNDKFKELFNKLYNKYFYDKKELRDLLKKIVPEYSCKYDN